MQARRVTTRTPLTRSSIWLAQETLRPRNNVSVSPSSRGDEGDQKGTRIMQTMHLVTCSA